MELQQIITGIESLINSMPAAAGTSSGDPRRCQPNSPELRVAKGQVTFDAEGIEGSKPTIYFSRQIHWPGGNSGVTIGRGYDMQWRTSKQIVADLTAAGVPLLDAQNLSRAAGLRGAAAQSFWKTNRATAPVISLESQKALFEKVVYPSYERTAKRVTQAANHNPLDWQALNPAIKDIIVDLTYCGDYRGEMKASLQKYIAANDLEGFASVMSDERFWRFTAGVPSGRFNARVEYLRNALLENGA